MAEGIRLVSINIERSKHLATVIPFVHAQKPDIVCMQEVCAPDAPEIAKAIGALSYRYAPMADHPVDEGEGTVLVGEAIFAFLPVAQWNEHYYVGQRDAIPLHDPFSNNRGSQMCCVLVGCDVLKGGETFSIYTTHFTWTPKGEATDLQREHLKVLLAHLDEKTEFVLTGDFNAPRMHEGKPGEIFSQLAARYKDNIPQRYETSIDIPRHRAGKIVPEELKDKMVDGLFTTSGYSASDVELHTGVSDHCAITAVLHVTQ